jgi:hypothetical protein
MSRLNKVNKSNYDQGGRLTPDDAARERKNARIAGKDQVNAKERPEPSKPDANRPRSAPSK